MENVSLPESDTFLAYLSHKGVITPDRAQDALATLPAASFQVPHLLESLGVAPLKIAQCLAEYLGIAFFDLSLFVYDIPTCAHLSAQVIDQYQILPLFKKDSVLHIGIGDPGQMAYRDEISFYANVKVCPRAVVWDRLVHLVGTYLAESQYAQGLCDKPDTQTMDDDQKIIQWVNHLLKDARQRAASDIHIEPYQNSCRIRFRQDGLLHEIVVLPVAFAKRVTARLKIMAHLDVSLHRLPQDGRFTVDLGDHQQDCRISVCPTLFGEKLVVRLLDSQQVALDIHALGFSGAQKKLFLHNIRKPQGLILITGPTGSGKTVTLYTALRALNCVEKNICTVEDPVEITLAGVQQTHVDTKINLTFASVLRAFLRQDPDILMVGEIRDPETAKVAIKAAQTGHLVFSTLHTNSAIEAITRLLMLEISPFYIAESVELIIAQRLVRVLCTHCKRARQVDASAFAKAGMLGQENAEPKTTLTVFEPVGCTHCTGGYKGRVGLFECVPMDDALARLMSTCSDKAALQALLAKQRIRSLYEAAQDAVKRGITSISEIQRVVL